MSLYGYHILFGCSKKDLYHVASCLLTLHPSLNSFIIPFSKELKKAPSNGENVIKTELPQTRHNKHKNSTRIQVKFFEIFTLHVIPVLLKVMKRFCCCYISRFVQTIRNIHTFFSHKSLLCNLNSRIKISYFY